MENFFRKFLAVSVLLSSLFFVTQSAYAAVGITEATAEISSSTDATTYSFGAIAPSANSVLVAFVSADATVAVATMSNSGSTPLTWTLETSTVWATTGTEYVFWAKTGASPASMVITFDCTGDQATGANMVLYEVTGADVVTANPIKQKKTSSSASGVPSITMDTAFTATNGALEAIGINRSAPALGTPTGWTQQANTGHSSPNSGIESSYRVGETASTITSGSGSAGNYGMIAVEVYASGTGPAAPTNTGATMLLMGG